LYELDCSYTLISGGLTAENFAGLDNLNYIVLDGNYYNSSVPLVFGQLQNLEFLYIADAFISGDLSYLEGMPKIVEHWIDFNPALVGPIYSFIGELATMRSLSLTVNKLTGTLPTELGDLTSMEQMWLTGNGLTGTVPSELGNLPLLKILQLEGNLFTGEMPQEVCDNTSFLKNLEVLGSDCEPESDFDCSCCTCCGPEACYGV
jgi:Leucine-rich repeat (LRR) protein